MLHERLVVLRVEAERVPYVAETERLSATELDHGIITVTLRFGFAEEPDVMVALRRHGTPIGVDPNAASFFLGRNKPVASIRPDLSGWQKTVFTLLANNAVRASDYSGCRLTRL